MLFCSAVWKWRVDMVIGLDSPKWIDFVDLSAAATGSPYAGMQIVGFATTRGCAVERYPSTAAGPAPAT